jgi:hypothetical protein
MTAPTPAERAVTAALLAESCAPGEGILAACVIDGVTTELYGTPVDLARVAVAAVWPIIAEHFAQAVEGEAARVRDTATRTAGLSGYSDLLHAALTLDTAAHIIRAVERPRPKEA